MAKTKKSTQKKYALLSVFDKKGIVEFAKILIQQNYHIISTGGTAKVLQENNIPLIPIQEITGNPESFDGRMKTISFQIESGILYDRSNKKHQQEADTLKIKPIDIVVCNLYPFEQTISKKKVTLSEAIENIDIGGPVMLRAAAKNFLNCLVIIDPNDYQTIAQKLTTNSITTDVRKNLAAKTFLYTSFYDSQIGNYLNEELFPEITTLAGRKLLDLRYGENPHQQGAVYLTPNSNSPFLNLTKHWGRNLSLTNITDMNAGFAAVSLFTTPAAVVIKHNSPCGIALGNTVAQALERAIESDPESAFGGVIVVNKTLDQQAAKIIEQFKKSGRGNFDIIAAPQINENVLSFLQSLRKSMGIYTFSINNYQHDIKTLKWIEGGFILQTSDNDLLDDTNKWEIVTKKKPSKKQWEQMQIAWKFLARIRSNAILIMDTKLPMTRGIGSGQTSRLRSTKIALTQANRYCTDGILASDSFFPFPDSIKLAAKKQIGAIVQQGGSINDKASIAEADKFGIPMVFTHQRAFWH